VYYFATGRKYSRLVTKELVYIAVSITNNCPYCIASPTASARGKGMTDEQFAELLAVIGLANDTNRVAIGARPILQLMGSKLHAELQLRA
jgi:AhpD family alkylhydroperoxidase